METARQAENTFQPTSLSHDDELSSQTKMSRPIFTITQSKIVKVETTRQAENLSKPLLYLTMMSYQAKPKYLNHFSVKYKAKLSKWRPLSKPLPYPTTTELSSQTKTPFFRWPARTCRNAVNTGLSLLSFFAECCELCITLRV